MSWIAAVQMMRNRLECVFVEHAGLAPVATLGRFFLRPIHKEIKH